MWPAAACWRTGWRSPWRPFTPKEVIEQALARYGTPEIVNTDQGSQFTAEEFTAVVLGAGCKLSMDGRGAWRDNVFVERLWRSVKYERVYLKAYDSVSAARADIADYLNWYNTNGPIRAWSASRQMSSTLPHCRDSNWLPKMPPLGAPRVAHRVGRFVASADRRRGQLYRLQPTLTPLKSRACCSNKGATSINDAKLMIAFQIWVMRCFEYLRHAG